MLLIINVLNKYYQNLKLKKLYKEIESLSNVKDPFEIEMSAKIRNESGDPKAIQIGHHVKLSGKISCKSGGRVLIGNYSVLQDGAAIRCLESIKIGNFTGIAGGCIITDNNTHALGVENFIKHRILVAPGGKGYPGMGNGWELSESKPVIIGDAVWIGENATILKGVSIGDGALVARGSIVTKDVPPYAIVAGNPAKVKKFQKIEESIESISKRLLKKQ